MMCGQEGCTHRVMDTTGYGSWHHVDTHGVPTDHPAIPTRPEEAPVAERVEITGNIRVHHPVREVAQVYHEALCCANQTGVQADCCCLPKARG